MKTSTKLFVGYGIAVALLMIACLCISASRYHSVKPAVEKLLTQFASTQINHVVVTEEGTGRRLTLEQGNVWLNKPAQEWEKPKSGKHLKLTNRVNDVRISGDTLYVTAPVGKKPWPIQIDLPGLDTTRQE